MKTVSASVFKQKCLALLDLVAETKEVVIVTKRGRPVAKVTAVHETPESKPLEGSVTFLTDDEEELFSTGETWDPEKHAEG
jgi:prevent-host-death family protein